MKKNRKLTPNQAPIATTITGFSHDGRGIAIAEDGKTTFVSGALLGEAVEYQFTKKHPRYNEADVVSIQTASPERTVPHCPHFSVCGGCSLQHMTSEAQIAFKQKILLEQLKHFGQVTPESILPPLSASPWGYRRKARLGVRYVRKKEKMLVGFREKSSSFLADMESCAILHPSVGEHLLTLREVLMSLTQFEHIPQIEVAIGDTSKALVFRHMQDLPLSDVEKLQQFGAQFSFDIYLQPNPPALLEKIWPEDANNRLSYNLPAYQLEMQFHPLDFTQINGEVNPLMIQQALQLLDLQATDKVLDLFCGLGNFTLPIARSAQQVVGVEGSQEMVVRGSDNAARNHIENATFFAANLAEIPATLPTWMKQQYDKILIDPPRTGAKEIIDHIGMFGAKRIVYVSCNPATLARDAGELVNKQGYRLKTVGVINMFPHTSHIEAIALFEK